MGRYEDSGRGGTLSDRQAARLGGIRVGLTLPAGSPGYMAPEQTQIAGAPDQRSDMYGLGALTYHLLTGEPPGQERRPPSDLQRAVPASVDAIVLRAMEPDREARWPSAAAFADALDRITSKIDTDPLAGVEARPTRHPGVRGLPGAGRWAAAAW